MKKMLNIVCFVFATTICWGIQGEQDRIARRIDRKVSSVKNLLREGGITQKNATSFITNMKKIIKEISTKPASDKLFLIQGDCESEIDIVRCLLNYQSNPTQKDASCLRDWANTSTFWAEIIIPEMNKQSDSRYKFNEDSLADEE